MLADEECKPRLQPAGLMQAGTRVMGWVEHRVDAGI
jgi:hypothetical protein